MDKTEKRIEELRSKAPENAGFQANNKKKSPEPKAKSQAGLWVIVALCLVALGGVLAFGASLISGRIANGTVVANVDLGGMEPDAAVSFLRELTEAQTLQLRDEDGVTLFTLPLTDLIGEQDYAANLSSAMTGGRLFTVEEESVAAMVNSALFPADYVAEEPTDGILLAGEDGLYLSEPTHGNLYDAEACTTAVCAFLDSAPDFGGIWTVDVASAYVRTGAPAGESYSEQKAAVEDFLASRISIRFVDDIEYTLTPDDIFAMLNEDCLNPESEVIVVPERVSAKMDELCEELGVDGVMAKYGRCADTRQYLYLLSKDGGYTLDRATLDAQIIEALDQREGQLSTTYDYTGWLRQTYGWHGDVNNCLEVSLDNQYIWFYHDGQLLTEAPIVSGDVATYNITRLGIFQIYGMVEDTVLTGPTWNDHVDYWMPFDGGIGIHDSDWRDEYGGDIYKENGSHGCVNTPLDAMRIIYENSFYGMMVIVR